MKWRWLDVIIIAMWIVFTAYGGAVWLAHMMAPITKF